MKETNICTGCYFCHHYPVGARRVSFVSLLDSVVLALPSPNLFGGQLGVFFPFCEMCLPDVFLNRDLSLARDPSHGLSPCHARLPDLCHDHAPYPSLCLDLDQGHARGVDPCASHVHGPQHRCHFQNHHHSHHNQAHPLE